jgi:hypothetical protein
VGVTVACAPAQLADDQLCTNQQLVAMAGLTLMSAATNNMAICAIFRDIAASHL